MVTNQQGPVEDGRHTLSGGPVLVADRLRKVVGAGALAVTAVDEVSLEVERGELIAVVGPSGSGKSTLLAMLGALSTPTAGTVRLEGVDPGELDERGRSALRAQRIGFVFQRPALVPFLTVTENILLAGQIAGSAEAAARERTGQLVTALGLEGRSGHRPAALSGGELQRVALARALLNDPVIVLADEPTANLDAERGRAVVALLAEHTREQGRAGVLVTHDDSVAAVADRTLRLMDGRLVEP
ncbi:MAG: ABC transporter ATP-binding protein [Nitriliruptor sp.]|nr:MAG: ABC transporter ATP-binding protein [Nitriliruptor sp.]